MTTSIKTLAALVCGLLAGFTLSAFAGVTTGTAVVNPPSNNGAGGGGTGPAGATGATGPAGAGVTPADDAGGLALAAPDAGGGAGSVCVFSGQGPHPTVTQCAMACDAVGCDAAALDAGNLSIGTLVSVGTCSTPLPGNCMAPDAGGGGGSAGTILLAQESLNYDTTHGNSPAEVAQVPYGTAVAAAPLWSLTGVTVTEICEASSANGGNNLGFCEPVTFGDGGSCAGLTQAFLSGLDNNCSAGTPYFEMAIWNTDPSTGFNCKATFPCDGGGTGRIQTVTAFGTSP